MIFRRLAEQQIRMPHVPLAIVIALAAIGAWLASTLELRTRFDQLLPENQPSVIAMRRAAERTSNAQTAFILLEGDDRAALRRFGDAIVLAMRALGPEIVASVEDGIQDAIVFFRPRAGLFLSMDEIDALQHEVDARWDWEVARQTGSALDDDSPAPPLAIQGHLGAKANAEGRFADGWYERADGKALVVVVRSPVPLGEIDRAAQALDRMKSEVRSLSDRDPALTNVRVTWTGDMVAGLVEYGAVRDDLLHVGVAGLALVLVVVVLHFARIRAILVLAATIACGLACTFGLTKLAIGHINVATGFLFSIVAGNGINVGILYLSRYDEEKRAGASTADAVRTAHLATWPSTSVAALAASASYASLAVTEFRTFKQFAFIGASGMLVCWAITIFFLPALLLVVDRAPTTSKRGVAFSAIFARLVPKAPRAILGAGLVVAVVGIASAAAYVARDPMEYDLSRIQNADTESAEVRLSWQAVTDILGKVEDAMIVLADRPEQAKEASAILQQRLDAAPSDAKPFESVRSIFDLVPGDQPAKITKLSALGTRLRSAHDRGLLAKEDWSRIEPLLPPADLAPFGIDDLPVGVARPFTERNGTRGTIVLVEPTIRENTNDLGYLLRYASAFRETRLADGTVLHGAGRALVFADILDAVVTQVPRAIALSLGLTLVAVVVAFRRGARSAAVLGALLVGLAGVATFLFAFGVRLNFLNYIALPITFGIGVDYAVNLVQRHAADGDKDILAALRTTGGAVVLCSLTTSLGYCALIGSHNQAIRSLGIVAVVGEIACLLAAVLVLPAGYLLLEKKKQKPLT